MEPTSLELAKREVTLLRPIATPKQIIESHKEAVAIIEQALEKGIDYGTIPGTQKPTLLKPGAERLCAAFGVIPVYEVVESEVDHDRWNEYTDSYNKEKTSQGLYRYVMKCKLVLRSDGSLVADGIGVCSTMESKYISRPRECENTACKMAEKRAHVAACLNAFGLSDRFTQDVEDRHGETQDVAPPPMSGKDKIAAHGLDKMQYDELKTKWKAKGLDVNKEMELAHDAGQIGFAALLKRCNGPEVVDAEVVEEGGEG